MESINKSQMDKKSKQITEKREKDPQGPKMKTKIRAYVIRFTHTFLYRFTIISTIIFDALTMALDADNYYKLTYPSYFVIASAIIMVIYTSEFLIKVYVERRHYCKNRSNLFDLSVLILFMVRLILERYYQTSILNAIRMFLALRVLKIASFVEGLQNLLKALYDTVKSAIYVLLLLLVVMLMFTIIGCYAFAEGDPEHWGDLVSAMFTLFALVSLDGWVDLQDTLDNVGYGYSRVFVIVFILIGFFLFFNMFTGVVLMELQFSLKRIQAETQMRQEEHIAKRQEIITKKYNQMKQSLVQKRPWTEDEFVSLVKTFKLSLNSKEHMLMDELYTSMSFIDMYLGTLDRQSTTLPKLTRLYEEVLPIIYEIESTKEKPEDPPPPLRLGWGRF